MTEIWRDIAGYEGLYQVSNFGRVRSSYRGGRILKPISNGTGYLYVNLYYDGKRNHAFVHRLVATAFIDNPDNKPQVNHLNGDKTNNHVENLEWATRSENQQHAYDTGLRRQGEDNPLAKLTDAQVVYIRNNPDNLSGVELAQVFGVMPITISEIQRGRIRTTAGGRIREARPKMPRIPDEVRDAIRREYVFDSHESNTYTLAKKYGVSQATVWNILKEATR